MIRGLPVTGKPPFLYEICYKSVISVVFVLGFLNSSDTSCFDLRLEISIL